MILPFFFSQFVPASVFVEYFRQGSLITPLNRTAALVIVKNKERRVPSPRRPLFTQLQGSAIAGR